MPKSNTKGGKNWKKGKKQAEIESTRRELIYKVDAQEYAIILRMLGDGRCGLQCFDGVSRQGIIRGSMRRRVWMNVGDLVLVALRGFQDDKCDIIHKYNPDEAKRLQREKCIPETARINQSGLEVAMDDAGAGDDAADADDNFDFEEI